MGIENDMSSSTLCWRENKSEGERRKEEESCQRSERQKKESLE